MRVSSVVLGCLMFAVAVPAANAGDVPVPVRVQAVELMHSHPPLLLSGTVQARIQADLAFRVGGKVIIRKVEVGDHVRAGDVLAELDPADLHFAEQSAEAAVQSAQADAANAAADLQRYQRLGPNSPAYIPSEYDKRLSAQRMAASRLVQAQRQLALAQNQSAYGRLVADADGVITALPVQVGQVVSAGQTVASLAHTDTVEILADVPENRLDDIRAASDIGIELWARPGLALHGRVREIGSLADAASRTFAVRITVLDAPAGLLALGMTATIGIATAGPEIAVLPAAALADQAGQPALWIFDASHGNARLQPVQIAGYAGDGTVLISGGVARGDQVITAGVQQISPGMKLTPWAGAAR